MGPVRLHVVICFRQVSGQAKSLCTNHMACLYHIRTHSCMVFADNWAKYTCKGFIRALETNATVLLIDDSVMVMMTSESSLLAKEVTMFSSHQNHLIYSQT